MNTSVITDNMLREAAAKVDAAILAKYPDNVDYGHVFSARHLRRMQTVFRKARKGPITHMVITRIACALVALLSISILYLTFNTEARADFFGWFQEQFGEFYHYFHAGDTAGSLSYDLDQLPEGYIYLDRLEDDHGATTIYIDGAGNIVQFVYVYGSDLSSLYTTTSSYHFSIYKEDNFEADIMLSKNSNEASIILWTNEDEHVKFGISAFADIDTLIQLAKSVTISEK